MKNKSKKRLGIDGALALIVLLTVLRQFFLGNYHNMFLGILTLILLKRLFLRYLLPRKNSLPNMQRSESVATQCL